MYKNGKKVEWNKKIIILNLIKKNGNQFTEKIRYI